MSIVLDSSSTSIERSGLIRPIPPSIPMFESPDSSRKTPVGMVIGDRRRPVGGREVEDDSAPCSISSIGRNSDGEDDSEEVQSSYKGPLDTMDALQESLPSRKGMSQFYEGKSKSFSSLADAAAASVKDLGKPENSYSRKRKIRLLISERKRDIRNNRSCISKRPANSSQRTLGLAVAMSSSESNTSEDHEPWLLPLNPQFKSSLGTPSPQWHQSLRSLSLTDLQSANSGLSTSSRYRHKKFH